MSIEQIYARHSVEIITIISELIKTNAMYFGDSECEGEDEIVFVFFSTLALDSFRGRYRKEFLILKNADILVALKYIV